MDVEAVTKQLEDFWNQHYMNGITKQLDELYPDLQITSDFLWKNLLSGDLSSIFRQLGENVKAICLQEIAREKSVVITILMIAVVTALFSMIMNIMDNKETAEIGAILTYMLMAFFLGKVFLELYELTEKTLGEITTFVELLLPAFTTAIVMSNGVSTGTVYHQGILILVFLVEKILILFLLPLTQVIVLLAILDGIWGGGRCRKLIAFLQQICRLGMKGIFAVFGWAGILQAMITPVIDSLQWNVVKKASSIIPGLGSITESSAELFVGAAILIRNGLGVFLTVMLFMICLIPFCHIGLTTLLVKGANALSALLSGSASAELGEQVSTAMGFLCYIMLTGVGLFFMAIAIVMMAVNRNG